MERRHNPLTKAEERKLKAQWNSNPALMRSFMFEARDEQGFTIASKYPDSLHGWLSYNQWLKNSDARAFEAGLAS